ncbi:hypothetical protein B5G42_11265 [Flavonifractor sp. An91]|nr:hypothetical protein B5G42_11265 [Flavonifractor sp. An91]
MLKTSRHQIRRMIQNGKLPAVKVDREWRIIRNGLRIIWGSRTNRNPRLSIGYFYTAGFESTVLIRPPALPADRSGNCHKRRNHQPDLHFWHLQPLRAQRLVPA